jgi:uncharacterized membrane protein
LEYSAKNKNLLIRVYEHINKHLLAGVIVLIPVLITWMVVRFFFDFFSGLLPSSSLFFVSETWAYKALLLSSSLISVGVLIYGIGRLGATVLGVRFVTAANKLVARIPIIQFIYGASKETINAIQMLNNNENAEKYVVLIEYPRPGLFALGFVTGEQKIADGRVMASVYIPTVPNPTSGMLAIVDSEELVITDIPTKEAMRIVLSGGLLSSELLKKSPSKSGGKANVSKN